MNAGLKGWYFSWISTMNKETHILSCYGLVISKIRINKECLHNVQCSGDILEPHIWNNISLRSILSTWHEMLNPSATPDLIVNSSWKTLSSSLVVSNVQSLSFDVSEVKIFVQDLLSQVQNWSNAAHDSEMDSLQIVWTLLPCFRKLPHKYLTGFWLYLFPLACCPSPFQTSPCT